MVASRGVCPKCGSDKVTKDKHQFGGDTGDLVCLDCDDTSTANEFKKQSKSNQEKAETE